MNDFLDCLDFKIKIIDWTILKVENIFKYKYDQQYGQNNIIIKLVRII